MSGYDYDLFVIGGGSGGVRAGRVAASMGKRVAVAEESRFGGTCVIRGCVPKKLFVYASQFGEHFEDAAGFGWDVGETRFDWPRFIAAKDREIARLEGLYRRGLETNGATILDTRAVFEGPHAIRLVAEDRVVTAERILIATGGRPRGAHDLEGGEFCISSNEIFHLERQPARIVIEGGGYIGVEFACILAGLGTAVTMVLRGDDILRGFDDDLRVALHREMSARGIRILANAGIARVGRKADGSLHATLAGGETIDADEVMLAIGRQPNTAGLGLEKAGVAVAANGAVVVDAFSRTNVPHILAVGDVTDRVQLTPVAIHEAMCLIETEFKGNPTSPDYAMIPTAVFAQPELGTVGMSEARAAREHGELKVFFTQFRPMRHTLSGRDEKMTMKIVVDAPTDRVLGVHILGPDAGEIAQTLAIALKMGARKADFDATMALHPSAAEELVTLYKPSWRVSGGMRIRD